MQLSEIIKDRIRQEGPIPFHDFMEMALYYPRLGYYMAAGDRIGANGDYYTSAGLSTLWGAMIGHQLEEMWDLTGRKDFTIVEYGAGAGTLCHDTLAYLRANKPFYRQLRYCIIEKSPAMRAQEKALLPEKVSWHDHISDIGVFTGCVLSNELLDNFSVHPVVMAGELMEVLVDDPDDFAEVLRPAGAELKDYLQQLQVVLPEGFRAEVNLEALDWLKEIAGSLAKGFVLTIDYGYPSAELYQSCRNKGTLMCYRRHHVSDNPYHHIGSQDITAHVNFSALNHWGLLHGLDYCGFTEQGKFLHALGLTSYIRALEQDPEHKDAFRGNDLPAVFNLLTDIGSKLKVMIQRKGLPARTLAGLQWSRTAL